jgi:ABC-type glutathione transport system ATPase component
MSDPYIVTATQPAAQDAVSAAASFGARAIARKHTKHSQRTASRSHTVYPSQGPKKFYYWNGFNVVRDEYYFASCDPSNGYSIIICGDSGSGKTTAVDMLLRGQHHEF